MATAKTTKNPIPVKYESNPFNLITASLEAYKLNIRGLVFAIVSLFVIALFFVIAVIVAAGMVYSGLSGGAALFGGLLLLLLLFSLYALYIQNFLLVIMLAAAQGQRLSIGEGSKRAIRLIPKLFVVGLLYALAVIGGFILFIIPGFIFMAWFALASLAAIHEDLGPVAALKRSRQLVRDHLIETWGLLGLQSTILGIVMLASMPVRYLQLVQLKDGKLDKAELHWANYVAIVIGMVSGITLNIPQEKPQKPYQPPAPHYEVGNGGPSL
ncbi:hypothetical protein EPO04_04015 [Patescibacteria group bacterium]|nr:MAG: hypothetical protein EPO04_04015 [Patescibacteria group bacterium]